MATAGNVIEFDIQGTDGFSGTFAKLSSGLGSVASSAAHTTIAIAKVGAVVSTAIIGAISAAAVPVLRTAATFESLRASLATVTGSVEKAEKAFAGIKSFASSTPFQVEEVTSAFIKLKSLGLTPSEDALRSYGNTASAMGKSLNQFIEAIADSVTGEFERLKEFGIKAKQEGDNVSFTFQGVTTTVKKNSQSIEGYLRGIGNVQFAGAMERQMGTLNGVWSNFQDTVSNSFDTLGRAGGLEIAKGLLRDLSGLVKTLTEGFIIASKVAVTVFNNIKNSIFESIAGGTVWTDFVTLVIDAFKFIATSVYEIITVLMPKVFVVMERYFKVAWDGFVSFASWAFDKMFQIFIGGFPEVVAAIGGFFVVMWEGVVATGQYAWDNIKAIFNGGELTPISELLFKQIPEKTQETRDNISKILGNIVIDGPTFKEAVTVDLLAATDKSRKELGLAFDDLSGYIGQSIQGNLVALGESVGITGAYIQEVSADVKATLADTNVAIEESNVQTMEATVTFLGELKAQFLEFAKAQKSVAEQLAKEMFSVYTSLVKSISNTIADVIVEGKSFAKAMSAVLKQVAKDIIASLIQVGIQRLVTASIFGGATIAEASTAVAANTATAATGAYASTVVIPIVGPALAPAAAANAGAATGSIGAAGIAAAIAAAAAIYALAGRRHAGGTIPKDGSYDLQRGEIVIPNNPSQDVVNALSSVFGATTNSSNVGGSSKSITNNASSRRDSSSLASITNAGSSNSLTSITNAGNSSSTVSEGTSSAVGDTSIVNALTNVVSSAKEMFTTYKNTLVESIVSNASGLVREFSSFTALPTEVSRVATLPALDRATNSAASGGEFTESTATETTNSNVTITNLNVSLLPNATSFDALMQMSERQMREVIAEKILTPLNDLSNNGVRSLDVQRLAV